MPAQQERIFVGFWTRVLVYVATVFETAMRNLMKTRREFLELAAGAAAMPRIIGGPRVPGMLDHILLGCADLERGIAFVEEKTGVKAAFGGVHPGRGTQNALLSLGTRRYLEIIAPDPKQSGEPQYPIITKLAEPRLIGWAAHPGDLQSLAARLAQSR